MTSAQINSYFKPVFQNRKSGSGEVLSQFRKSLLTWISEGNELNNDTLNELVIESVRHLGHFAVVLHFLNQLLQTNDRVAFLKGYEEKWSGLPIKLARMLRSVQSVQNQTILLHSNSSSIVALFKELSQQGTKETMLFQSISHPGREGLIQGKELAEQGWTVRFIEDAVMGRMLTQCDYVLLGSDVITDTTFINKAGSMPTVAAAKLLGTPVYVVGDERKLINDKTLPENIAARLLNEDPKSDKELKLNTGQSGINYYFEHIPCSWVNGFILSDAIYSPTELSSLIERHSYSHELINLVS